MKRYIVIVLWLLSFKSHANHIAGGEMIYDFLGNDNYRITLKIYRDCAPGNPNFDGLGDGTSQALMSVLDANGISIGVYDIGLPVVTPIPPTINSPCLQAPNNICVEEGVYTYTVNLPPKTGGYYVIYQRCCRNATVLNLLNSVSVGSTYYAQIPGPESAVNNNSPRFKSFPPIFLCDNVSFSFDHSALDPDGDQLVYSLCEPFEGLNSCCASLVSNPFPAPVCDPGGCPTIASPPPYTPVNYLAPYSGSYPIASSPSFAINASTGLLVGKPNLIGQFVVSVCVQEFRNSVLIGTHQRDFQFNIVPCIISVVSAVADPIKECVGNTISFTNLSTSNIGQLTYLWDFGVSETGSDTSSLTNPTFTYQDTGKYTLTLIADPGKECADTSQKIVYVYPPLSINYDPLPAQCLKNNSFSFATEGTYTPQATFHWDFTSAGSPSTSTLKNPTGITFTQGGLFFVKLLARQFACRDSFTDSVRVFNDPQAKINNLPETLCDPGRIGFSNGSISDFPMSYYWTFSNGQKSTAFEPIQIFTPAGIYTASLMVITQGICADTSSTSIDIPVSPLPLSSFSCSPETTSIFEPEIDISNQASSNVISWRYDFGDGTGTDLPDAAHFYQTYGNYVIKQTVTTQFGCQSTSERDVKILPEYRFWVPNTFTPDNNSLNDIFGPVAMGIDNYDFQIFDRWGKKIFETAQLSQGWNGKFKGEDCPQDVYIWRATFKNVTTLEDETHSGYVLILREE